MNIDFSWGIKEQDQLSILKTKKVMTQNLMKFLLMMGQLQNIVLIIKQLNSKNFFLQNLISK